MIILPEFYSKAKEHIDWSFSHDSQDEENYKEGGK